MTDRTTQHPGRRLLSVALLAMALVLGACTADGTAVEELSAQEAADLLDESGDELVLIDVRTPEEFAEGHVQGARNLDLEGGELEAALDGLDRDARYVLYCATGNRSGQAAELMADAGFTAVYDAGGFTDLADAGVPTST